jgi:hypothetical protein
MPLAHGYFKKKEKAREAINKEKWEDYTGHTLQEVKEGGMVGIDEIDVK